MNSKITIRVLGIILAFFGLALMLVSPLHPLIAPGFYISIDNFQPSRINFIFVGIAAGAALLMIGLGLVYKARR